MSKYKNGRPISLINTPRCKVGLIIPTLNAGRDWRHCLNAIERQTLTLSRIVIIDSASSDQTCGLAESAGFEVIAIDRSQFNHGGTRQWAANFLTDCEILVFLTQDAILAATDALENLVACFLDLSVAVAYGRQTPHVGAGAIAAHARQFNYGTQTVKKDRATVTRLGPKAFFCSNSFAAYRRSLLLQLGGFRNDLILGEDMEFAARAIDAGYANMYCASAPVHHSHEYTLTQTFERYFDLGAFESQMPLLRERFGSHTGEGKRFIKSELSYLWVEDRLAVPKAILQTGMKFLGYRLGLFQKRLPVGIKRKLSMMPNFWG